MADTVDTRKNLDKRTARTRYADIFKGAIAELRDSYTQHGRHQEAKRSKTSHRIDVYARVRPLLPHEVARGEYTTISCIDEQTMVVHDCMMHADMIHKYIETHAHTFTKVFNEDVPTEAVYSSVAKPLVDHAIAGGESVCMMYGQTGSGKTHTMLGFLKNIAADVFDEGGSAIIFKAVELVGSKCVDLLHERTKVLICEDDKGEIELVHSASKIAASADDLFELFTEATNNRTTEATQVNAVSSRSHLICFLQIESVEGSNGQLVLLDLAGSERKEDQVTTDRARHQETIETNMAHLALKQCLLAMSQDPPSHIPYRNSALTRILKNHLWSTTKQSRAAVVVTASPIPTDTEHTLTSLIHARAMVEAAPAVSKTIKEIVEGELNTTPLFKTWSAAQIQAWLPSLKKGALAKYAINIKPAYDGAAVLRFPPARFRMLCGGNAEHGKWFSDAVKALVAEEKKLDAERRARNMAMKRK
ncbi:kinesin-like protein [Achlya hypogyna]|uniref:Kinesin-like protein n=1 Tax=Achlya hypogyna TaxID=1202772 RepID=A0A1V9ZCK0_ACHHY|nr:kinesin-like protein [Achlya hypogyna]